MKIKLQNIGIIESADINISGITLIAGQNDSGKSTVGKVLYSIVRSLNINEKSFNSSKNEYVRGRVRDIRNLLLRTKPTNENDQKILNQFNTDFIENRNSPFERLFVRFNITNTSTASKLLSDLENIHLLFQEFSNESLRLQLNVFITEINNRLRLERDSIEVLHYELDSFFQSEFGKQVKNRFIDGESFISFDEETQKKITFGETIKFENFESNLDVFYDDVFFIESPIKLVDSGFYYGDSLLRDKSAYLNNKIFEPESEQDIFSDNRENFEKLNKIISELIKGDFELNSNDELVFKKNGVEFDFNNVATGIKSFGILQMLLKKGLLNSNSLLIIDEPEVHLHPSWQVFYAELLVRLSKEFAIPMVLTSHSPYFIESLDLFSKKYQYKSVTVFV